MIELERFLYWNWERIDRDGYSSWSCKLPFLNALIHGVSSGFIIWAHDECGQFKPTMIQLSNHEFDPNKYNREIFICFLAIIIEECNKLFTDPSDATPDNLKIHIEKSFEGITDSIIENLFGKGKEV